MRTASGVNPPRRTSWALWTWIASIESCRVCRTKQIHYHVLPKLKRKCYRKRVVWKYTNVEWSKSIIGVWGWGGVCFFKNIHFHVELMGPGIMYTCVGLPRPECCFKSCLYSQERAACCFKPARECVYVCMYVCVCVCVCVCVSVCLSVCLCLASH